MQSLSKEELLAELRGLLDENRELRQRFELRAAAMNTDALAIRRAVMDFIMPPRGEYLAHDEVYRYANEIYKAVVPARPRRPNPFRSATTWPDYCWTTAVNFIPIWTTMRNF